ncbi:MAG: retropepsin-like aspartic protease [FCB group bacterium]|jgi:clan AA aspartic protease (TIGR02281 family)|nr:retropepsin-like aspartic protease [FCB group bacterium]
MRLLLLVFFPLTVWASDYYECVSPTGQKTYQLERCAKDHKQTSINDPTPPVSRRVDRVGEVVTTQIFKSGNHYHGTGHVNGKPFRMLVDTGASFVSMSRDQALASGVPVRGRPMRMQTANGAVRGLLSTADTINFAGHEVRNVPVVVQVEGKPFPGILLGMSFLSHFDINMAGSTMSMTRK